jgi:hypothetical protein
MQLWRGRGWRAIERNGKVAGKDISYNIAAIFLIFQFSVVWGRSCSQFGIGSIIDDKILDRFLAHAPRSRSMSEQLAWQVSSAKATHTELGRTRFVTIWTYDEAHEKKRLSGNFMLEIRQYTLAFSI